VRSTCSTHGCESGFIRPEGKRAGAWIVFNIKNNLVLCDSETLNLCVQPGRRSERIDDQFSADDETVPCGEVATAVSLRVYLGPPPSLPPSLPPSEECSGLLCVCQGCQHGFQTEISIIWQRDTHSHTHTHTLLLFSVAPHKHDPPSLRLCLLQET